jgi:hypothetical protein
LARQNKKILNILEIEPGVLQEFKIGGAHKTSKIEIKDTTVVTTNYDWSNYRGGNTSSVSGGKSNMTQTTAGQTNGCGGSNSNVGDCTQTEKSTTTSPIKGTQLTAVPSIPRVDPDLGHTPCTDFPKGTDVLVRFYEAKLDDKEIFYTVRGKTLEPGREEIDVLAYVPASLGNMGNNIRKWTSGPCLANIIKHTNSVNGGRSLFLSNIKEAPLVEVQNGRIPEREWKYAMNNLKCKHCSHSVDVPDQLYTSVSRKTGNKLVVTCPDCIEDKLDGDLKYEFTQNRLATLQAWEHECHTASGSTQPGAPVLKAPDSPTLH